MNIVLLNPPGYKLYIRDQYCCFSSKSKYYWPPIDLLVQSGVLGKKHNLRVIDAIVEELTFDQCMEEICKEKTDVILCVTGISSFLDDFEFLEKVKIHIEPLVFVTGGFLLSEYKNILSKYEFLDGILLDFTSSAVLDFLDGKTYIENLAYRQDEKIVFNFSNHHKIEYPMPMHEIFNLKKYHLPHGKEKVFSCMITNYGCPYKCDFCIAQRIDYRTRRLSDIVNELIYIKKLGINEVFIKDFTFGVNREDTLRLCKEIKNKVEISWICASRVDVLDEAVLSAMKEAGCHTIQFGVESSNEDILLKYKDGIHRNRVISTFELCRKYNIKTLGHFIFGLPGDTKESINNTIRFAKYIKCDYASFNIATPLPGTILRSKCRDNNWLDENIVELDLSCGKPAINTEQLSGDVLEKLKKKAYRRFYFRINYILKRLINVKSYIELKRLIREGLGVIKNNI